jgi:hypothetical protein
LPRSNAADAPLFRAGATGSVKYDVNNKTWRATMNAAEVQLKAAPEFKYDGLWRASRS